MEDVPPQVNDVLLADFGWFQFINLDDGFSKKKKKKITIKLKIGVFSEAKRKKKKKNTIHCSSFVNPEI